MKTFNIKYNLRKRIGLAMVTTIDVSMTGVDEDDLPEYLGILYPMFAVDIVSVTTLVVYPELLEGPDKDGVSYPQCYCKNKDYQTKL